jgi:hypothetical protein
VPDYGTLLGETLVHSSEGAGKDCFYLFDYGIVAIRQSSTFACPDKIPWFAATHGRLIKALRDHHA